jgi:histidinol-phosphate aminotransferase
MIDSRPHLHAISPYEPGRSIEQVIRERGIADPIKLASNENPYGPLPSVIDAIVADLANANRYPEDGAPSLRAKLAERFGLSADWFAVGCGSLDLLQQLVIAMIGPGDKAIHGVPTFPEYPRLPAMLGGESVGVALRDGAYDLEAIAAAVDDQTRMVIVCSPNNPTGGVVAPEALEALCAAVPSNVMVLFDEAYREFVTDAPLPDTVALVQRYPNLVVSRTFSKAYGLAGLRIGYVIADPAVTELLGKVHLTFAVSRVAEVAAIACLEPAADAELMERVRGLAAGRASITDALRGRGLEVPTSHANAVFAELPGGATAVADWFEQRGVIIRALGPDAFRVTVGTPAENDRFLALLADAPLM